MNEFIWNVLDELCSGLILAALVLLPAAVGLWLRYRKHGSVNWKRLIPLALLACYTAVVISVTLFRAELALYPNTHLFRAWREAWNTFSVRRWGNVLLNIAMFVPLGVLIHLSFPKCWGIRTVLVVIGATVLLETVQLFGSRGVFDVDDLFANVLGGLMGWCLLMAVLSVMKKRWGVGFAFFLLAMIPVASVGGIFAAYYCQPYGNLPEAYVYRVDTEDIEWVLDCDLPEVWETAAVYKAPARTKAECDDYAEEMAEFWGGEYDDVYYYDDEIYYRDYDTGGRIHYLTLSRLDGSLSFWMEELDASYDTNEWPDLSRAETEAVLAQYGITIPSEAEFLGLVERFPDEPEYQSIIFRADQIPVGRGLLDGTCYVEVTEDGSYLNVNNRLVAYEYHAEESIRTPEEALKLLQDGCFGNGWRYDAHLFGEFSVQSCSLSYALDTKGFYQPVYYFEVTGNNWNGTAVIMIPAIT